jgi:hypothetical protein
VGVGEVLSLSACRVALKVAITEPVNSVMGRNWLKRGVGEIKGQERMP